MDFLFAPLKRHHFKNLLIAGFLLLIVGLAIMETTYILPSLASNKPMKFLTDLFSRAQEIQTTTSTGTQTEQAQQGALFGAFVQQETNHCAAIDHVGAIHSYEGSDCLNAHLGIDRLYYRWDPATFAASTKELTNCGESRVSHISFRPLIPGQPLTPIQWTQISNGSQDSVIDQFATKLKTIQQNSSCTLWITFNHEADNDANDGYSGYHMGTAQEFAAAWRHFFDRLTSDGVAFNQTTQRVLVLDHWIYKSNASQFDPGSNYLDAYGSDSYNRPFCKSSGWTELSELNASAINYADSQSKPLYITEWGSEKDPNNSQSRTQWITNAMSWIQSNPTVAATEYWNGSDGACDYRLNNDPEALSALSQPLQKPTPSPTPTPIQTTPTPTPTPFKPTPTPTPFKPTPTPTNEPTPTPQIPTSTPSPTPTLAPSPTPTPPPPGDGVGLVAKYYGTRDFRNLRLTQIDPTIDFDWDSGGPFENGNWLSKIFEGFIPGTNTFSIRWTGRVVPLYTETYNFYTHSDDGVRLWVGDQLLIDHWNDHPEREDVGSVTLVAGQSYPINLVYYENQGVAQIKLLWSSPSQSKQIIPTSQLFPQ